MMRRALLCTIVMCSALALVVGQTRAQSTLSLLGTIYFAKSTAPQAPAVNLMVELQPNGSATKIGPIYTDSDGRFAFYNVPRGTYKMIIYRGTDIVWQQNVNVPNASLPPIVLH